ncbi:unnamed protein product [Cylindrotheca closterium]|uniref:lipoyl(octanoyl) transferase n=1 Tax=Cylindrotheca closterium TaxID=2856 RepID=A0AAD2CQ56_9STRA|nr:unnamed protein product [Cylindrotheca closterium]
MYRKGPGLAAEVILPRIQNGKTKASFPLTSKPPPPQPKRTSRLIQIHNSGISVELTLGSKGQRRSMSSAASDTYPQTAPAPPLQVYSALDKGCLDYSKSWAWQHTLLSRRLAMRRALQENDSDCVLLLEHAPVYTLGRGSDEGHITFLSTSANEQEELLRVEQRQQLSRRARGPGTARLAVDRRVDDVVGNLPLDEAIQQLSDMASPVLAPNGVPIFRVERGGEVTWHGPSQLVVYPLLDLQREPYQKDLHWYLRMIEEVVIQTLKHYDIDGDRDEENTGVWVNDEKVAAVGISSSRWITTHGFALNLDPNLEYFDASMIVPCGIEGKGVTSIAKIMRERGDARIPGLQEVAVVVLEAMMDVFQLSDLQVAESPKLDNSNNKSQ